ncbi:hypothetical protein CH282_16875 [Rhodococcus sp. 06-418-1B]|nr:hypothetical protein CH282_16875 [Rhodococcus sp. 06-418-1B]
MTLSRFPGGTTLFLKLLATRFVRHDKRTWAVSVSPGFPMRFSTTGSRRHLALAKYDAIYVSSALGRLLERHCWSGLLDSRRSRDRFSSFGQPKTE